MQFSDFSTFSYFLLRDVILWVETSQPCRTFRTCNPTLTMFTCWTDSCLSELIFCTSVFNCCKLLLKLLLLLRRTMWWIFNRRSTFYRVTKCCHVSPRLSKNVQICHDFTNDVKHVYHSNAKWWSTFVRWWNACTDFRKEFPIKKYSNIW